MSHSRSYTPTDNPRIERFYKTMKVENEYFLNQDPFEAKNNFRNWVHDYNFIRHHTTIKTTPTKKGLREHKEIYIK